MKRTGFRRPSTLQSPGGSGGLKLHQGQSRDMDTRGIENEVIDEPKLQQNDTLLFCLQDLDSFNSPSQRSGHRLKNAWTGVSRTYLIIARFWPDTHAAC